MDLIANGRMPQTLRHVIHPSAGRGIRKKISKIL
jgi:hypothetical protein